VLHGRRFRIGRRSGRRLQPGVQPPSRRRQDLLPLASVAVPVFRWTWVCGGERGQLRGVGVAVAVDHLKAAEVEALVQRIDAEQGRLDILVNDIWGR
jgi:NAD(P)-dependent dehydrogenase (short-subunit alcohol dehydrogenase family)